MKIVCAGGGPAGLYLAISAKLRNNDHDITVIERNPAGITYGWGVVFWDDLLDSLYLNDPVSARAIQASSTEWDGQQVHLSGRNGRDMAYLGGYGYSLGRARLLDLLTERALQLGVDVRFRHEADQLADFEDADLVVACDGASSRFRKRYPDWFQTGVRTGRNKYLWLGTHRVFESFLFAFEETEAGWIWLHAYPFDAETSTVIVECSPETWRGLGFHELDDAQTLALLEEIFASYLDGHALMTKAHGGERLWLNFRCITNDAWYRDNLVLMGDAAHTTHFSIGSGTKLAIEDAITLADKLTEHQALAAALRAYQEQRTAALFTIQQDEHSSTRWFENVPRHVGQDPVEFAYSLWQRRGHHPLWRHQLHRASQVAPVRRLRRSVGAARRYLHARRRLRLAGSRRLAVPAAPAHR